MDEEPDRHRSFCGRIQTHRRENDPGRRASYNIWSRHHTTKFPRSAERESLEGGPTAMTSQQWLVEVNSWEDVFSASSCYIRLWPTQFPYYQFQWPARTSDAAAKLRDVHTSKAPLDSTGLYDLVGNLAARNPAHSSAMVVTSRLNLRVRSLLKVSAAHRNMQISRPLIYSLEPLARCRRGWARCRLLRKWNSCTWHIIIDHALFCTMRYCLSSFNPGFYARLCAGKKLYVCARPARDPQKSQVTAPRKIQKRTTTASASKCMLILSVDRR